MESVVNKDSVVKVDFQVLKEVEEFIKKKENRLIYANKKQFVDIAIFEKLNKDNLFQKKLKQRLG